MFGTGSPLPPLPQDIWLRWNWNSVFLLAMGLIAWAYLRGVQNVWRRAGAGRGVRRWQPVAFMLGLAALFVAFISPLEALATALFSAHMIQHLLLILVAAPLLVAGAPLVPFLWMLPKSVRRDVGRYWKRTGIIQKIWHGLTQPLPVWFFYATVLWLWHLPYLYQQALARTWVHELEHVTFLGAALGWWWIVLRPTDHRRLKHGATVLFIFTTALHSGALGALISFAQVPLYPVYASTAAAWGVTLLEDQQL
ncbi:MAG: cytochrome c oxidase assembly protein, partial [Anaerolineae bacterium]|nr:cytochrome c oxidase assembly protein [Anaerolineae bacterium]